MNTRQVTLDEATHKYTDELKREYISVTTLIGKYEKPFNKIYWSVWTALKNLGFKMQPDEPNNVIVINGYRYTLDQIFRDSSLKILAKQKNVTKQWAELTEESCKRGTATHNELEDGVNGFYKKESDSETFNTVKEKYGLNVRVIDIKTLNNSPLKTAYPAIYDFLLNCIEKGYTLFAEKRVYYEGCLLAGTIDILAVRGKEFLIIDWKTNKDVLHFESGYYKKVKVQTAEGKIEWIKSNNWIPTDDKLLHPLNHLPKCKGTSYTMQLSTYAWMVEQFGYKCLGLCLVHIRKTSKESYPPVFMKIEYKRPEVITMINHYSAQNGFNLIS